MASSCSRRVDGRPLVEWALAALAAAPLGDRVIVLGAHADELLAAIDLHGARPVRNEHWERGMASSLHAGLAALDPACTAALVVLGDGPGAGGRGHPPRRRSRPRAPRASWPRPTAMAGAAIPVAIPRALWAQLPREGEQGARVLGEPAVLVDCSDLPAPGDADTPADLP